jgi:hypothetical protein
MGVPEREGVLEYISERSPRNLIVIFPEGVFLEINGIAIHFPDVNFYFLI